MKEKTMDKAVSHALTLVNKAKAMVIFTPEDCAEAVSWLDSIKVGKDKVEEVLGAQKEASYKAYKVALDKYNEYMKPLEQAERHVKDMISSYQIEQEQILRQEQERLDAEARQREAREKARLEARAQTLAKKGKAEEAQELLSEAESLHVPAVQIPLKAEKVAGIQAVDDWNITITSPIDLVRAIAAGQVIIDPGKLCTFKVSVLKEYVKLTGVASIPGCHIEKVKAISRRSA